MEDPGDINIRMAEPGDLPALGDLRWRFMSGDAADFGPEDRDRFVSAFVAMLRDDEGTAGLVHWVAESGERILAVMSVRTVRQLPSPGRLKGTWGYLTNCYTLPAYRNGGIGAQLLEAVKGWAEEQDLELLVVWPSEPATPFYRRGGFAAYPDPLVLKFKDDD